MRELIYQNYGFIGNIVAATVIVLLLFFVLGFFKSYFSNAFLGLLLSLVSYFVYDYAIFKIPLIALVSFILCVTSYQKGFLRKIFALVGTLFSAYLILHSLGVI